MISYSNDTRKVVLMAIDDRKSIREIAAILGKSIGTIQQILAELEEDNYIINPFLLTKERKARSRYLTEKGKNEISNRQRG